MLTIQDLKEGAIVQGASLQEPVKIIKVIPLGTSVQIMGQGLQTNSFHQPIFSPDQLIALQITPEQQPFDGNAQHFRLGVESLRLKLAYEYDPFFSLTIARNEFMTAERLKGDYWLYVVYNCASTPELHRIQNPAQLQWQPWRSVEHYQLGADAILNYKSSGD